MKAEGRAVVLDPAEDDVASVATATQHSSAAQRQTATSVVVVPLEASPERPPSEEEVGVPLRLPPTTGDHLTWGGAAAGDYSRCHSPAECVMLALCRALRVRSEVAREFLTTRAEVCCVVAMYALCAV